MSNIQLFAEPRKTYKWAQFKKLKPKFSIGLDGIITSVTKRHLDGPFANFDHHSNVDRLATRSTTAQVYLEINMGLFNVFRENGVPTANIFVNDSDEDTSLAVWLLRHHEQVVNNSQPAINRLVYCEDVMDCTGGAYLLGDTEMRRKMAWIFEPYNEARFTGRLHNIDNSGMIAIIDSIDRRITEYSINGGKEIALEGSYVRIGGGKDWTFVKETGPAARMAMYNNGISAFVSLVAEREDGSYVYSIGRRSVWVPFSVDKIYHALNKREKAISRGNNKWGGSDTIGGSPRETGSRLSPEEVTNVIDRVLKS